MVRLRGGLKEMMKLEREKLEIIFIPCVCDRDAKTMCVEAT